MIDLMAALFAFWSQFGIPAYLQDCVPHDAQLPYITYNVSRNGWNGSAYVTVFNWHYAPDGGNRERAEVMSAIAQAIRPDGVMLDVGEGYAILSPNDTDFQTIYNDAEDEQVIGGRTSCILQTYTL